MQDHLGGPDDDRRMLLKWMLNNTGRCRPGSAYLVAGFYENSDGQLFRVEETANFFLTTQRLPDNRRLYYMEIFTVLKSDSFHILSVC